MESVYWFPAWPRPAGIYETERLPRNNPVGQKKPKPKPPVLILGSTASEEAAQQVSRRKDKDLLHKEPPAARLRRLFSAGKLSRVLDKRTEAAKNTTLI